jgi:predicted protein tyrosine phosphatase
MTSTQDRDDRERQTARRGPLLPYRMTICGLDELPQHLESEVTHVLSILDPNAPTPRILEIYPELRQRWTLRFHDIATPAPLMNAPGSDDVDELLAVGRELDSAGADSHLLVHCHAGVSRSTAAAGILMARSNPGRESEAFETVIRLRPGAVPNQRMVKLADRRLQRDGRLVEGLERMQARRFDGRRPGWWR